MLKNSRVRPPRDSSGTSPFDKTALASAIALVCGWVFNDGRRGLELFVTNVFDEQAQFFINTAHADVPCPP